MVDVVRAVAAATAVQTPLVVHAADAQNATLCAATSFLVSDSLAGVFRDLSPTLEPNCSETPHTVNE